MLRALFPAEGREKKIARLCEGAGRCVVRGSGGANLAEEVVDLLPELLCLHG